jgi:hypothetical protein
VGTHILINEAYNNNNTNNNNNLTPIFMGLHKPTQENTTHCLKNTHIAQGNINAEFSSKYILMNE